MTISMYEASAPRFAGMLRNLDAILAKAQAYAVARKIDPIVLTGARLFPDMLPLRKQDQALRPACARHVQLLPSPG